ncbi:MAG: hypothetical protein A2X18_14385 [Bacteroidetes bacterium GWF2_40_14]|nr:MAG: hypothetical protein A2X18_14385 [Bacteroidetes bacterium GWF2_40_14]
MNNNLKVVIFSSSLHDSSTLLDTRVELFNELRSEYEVELIDSSQVVSSLAGEDLVIAFIATGGTEEKFAGKYQLLSNPVVILSDSYHNSLAASLEISSWLSNKEVKHKHLNFPLSPSRRFCEDFKQEVSALMQIQLARYKLSKAVVGLIGGESSWLISSKVNLNFVSEKFETKFLPINISELEELYKNEDVSFSINEPLIQEMTDKRDGDRSQKDITDAIKMYLALNKLIDVHNLSALTIKCFDLLSSCRTTSCLALSLLNDRGIVAGCEGDIPSLWSMLIADALCGTASFMANPSSIEVDEKSVDFAHCTAPVSLSKSYTLPSHYESKIGIGIAAQLPLGKYTIFKCSGENLDRYYAYEGEIVQNTSVVERCRTQVKFIFKSALDLDEFLNSHSGNHAIILPGKHKKILSEFFNLN